MTSAFYQRRAGLLLHPTSLPSGVLDSDADRWIDLLCEFDIGLWQVLPLGEPMSGLSPYQCVSAYAMNPALLAEYPPIDIKDEQYHAFCHHNSWVDDYVLFMLLSEAHADKSWTHWPHKYKDRDPAAISRFRFSNKHGYHRLAWHQYQLHKRWMEVKQKANDCNIQLFGDMPLFVAHDSVEVWKNPERFQLDDDGHMTVVAGVPPDYYSETGQRWGNPHYDWEVMQQQGFAWWVDRIDYHLQMFDVVRIDHFRGLEASWVIDADCETAIEGYWEKMPGDELLALIKRRVGDIPIVAEDLGVITPEVTALREKYELPGMSVLQFGFDQFDDNPHKRKNIHRDRVVYTGTHDNDTTAGWFESLDASEKASICQQLGIDTGAWPDTSVPELTATVIDTLIQAGMESEASLCIVPLQDLLQLGSEARMNTPGTVEGNWQWSFQWDQLSHDKLERFQQVLESSNRKVSHG